uniref:Cytochrome c family protein n=1 Tax=Rhodopseudomonas palustris (strain BisA53) TaxID=316055 RepID=Q07GZ8_RHOP5
MPTKTVLAILAAAAVGLVLLTAPQRTADRPALEAKAAALIKDYAATLQGALKGAIEKSGPDGAVVFCNKEAPGIAEQASSRSGWSISRTSLKPRNPASAPDAYEREAMAEFAARAAAGEPAASLKRADIIEQDGERVFRYLQAIPTGELCLGCHGSDLKPKVSAKINEYYPADQATGFKQGDLRGAFTLSTKL